MGKLNGKTENNAQNVRVMDLWRESEMIDYQKHRKRLDAVKSYPEMNYEWRRGREEAADKLYDDSAELLDKAEKWDKVNEGLAVDGIHTSKGILGELYELREKREILENIIEKINAMAARDLPPSMSQRIIDISSEAIEDPATVEEGKG